MKATRRTLLALVGAMAVGAAVAAPSVEITSVQQQYPWTNTVDIVYNVAGVDSETNGYFVVFTPTTSTGAAIPDVNGATSVQVALKGSGVYSTQWFPQTNLQYTACKMTPSVFRGAARDYMIVDLEDWTVAYEPMATQEASNQRYNTDEYKTKKLVLRRIPADDYTIGDDNTAVAVLNRSHTVNMPKDYYIGIFEVTESQYDRLNLASPAGDSKLPIGNISWNTIRGSALAVATPTMGVLATLNAKTGLGGFDLPTVSMWEVAARAGCTTTYLWGDEDASVMRTEAAKYAWCKATGGSLHEVGLLQPNAWGLYDVHGNVVEWCRDVFDDADLSSVQADGLKVISSGSTRMTIKGGGIGQQSNGLALSGYINSGNFTAAATVTKQSSSPHGFRVAYIPQE